MSHFLSTCFQLPAGYSARLTTNQPGNLRGYTGIAQTSDQADKPEIPAPCNTHPVLI